ncbi:secretin N-terminal domain-containing protein [Stutzerimonas azotifigens]|uniref:Secretin n=1 Tax=Stutzerimonas azotifigens TaxID=291995 RepID=A0ABR5Z0Z9_9GAMM|nr:secretin N-terminal domain-containing protein [Stutzerimonas azotifigens]MBA1273851.1 secretin [Stutzerimonas azotifigens]
MKRHLLAALILLASLPLHAATEVITLDFRMAEDVMPIAQSVVGDQGKVSAYGNQLIVNAPDAIIAELRTVLAQLDNAPKRLLISVDTQDAGSLNQRGYGVDGSISAGNVEIEAGRGEVRGRDQVRIIRHSTQTRDAGVQQVQATEGYPALIQVGQSVPLTSTGTDGYGQVYQNTQYRNVMRGFYATATLSGDRVQVTISNNRDRLNQHQPGVIDVQTTETRVTGRVGEWLTLGGVSESQNSTQNGNLRRYSTQGQQDLSLRLKVDVLD